MAELNRVENWNRSELRHLLCLAWAEQSEGAGRDRPMKHKEVCKAGLAKEEINLGAQTTQKQGSSGNVAGQV